MLVYRLDLRFLRLLVHHALQVSTAVLFRRDRGAQL